MPVYTCPYCSTKHAFTDIEFRCGNQMCRGKKVDDVYYKYLNINLEDGGGIKMNPVFRSRAGAISRFARTITGGNSSMQITETCKDCNRDTHIRVCPSCHCELPQGIDEGDSTIIAVVGGTDAGKTVFLSVLLNELERNIVPNELNGSFMSPLEDVRKRYTKYYYNQIYVSHKIHEHTDPWDQVTTVEMKEARKPLIYNLTINKKKVTLAFFDIAGEDCNDEQVMETVAKYIPCASGIIMIMDPLQIAEFRASLDPEIVNSSTHRKSDEIRLENPGHLVSRIVNIINQGRNNGKIKIPLAVAFSKADIMIPELPKGCATKLNSQYLLNKRFNKAECQMVSSEMETFLKRWGQAGMVQYIRENFSNYSFGLFSALGQPPQVKEDPSWNTNKLYTDASQSGQDQKKESKASYVGVPSPIRIADALIYLLHEKGIIR